MNYIQTMNSGQMPIRRIMLEGKEIEDKKLFELFIESHVLEFNVHHKVFSVIYKANGITTGFAKIQNKTLVVKLSGRVFNESTKNGTARQKWNNQRH